jgi:hypothetical protein
LLFALDEAEHVRLATNEMRVLEVPKLSVRIRAEDALLEVRNLVKTVHVKLANK